MQREKLKKTLNILHRELADETDVDPELQALLATLDDDIHQLLEAGSSVTEDDGLMDAAEALAARFAADHPRVEAMVREVIAALGKMGV